MSARRLTHRSGVPAEEVDGDGGDEVEDEPGSDVAQPDLLQAVLRQAVALLVACMATTQREQGRQAGESQAAAKWRRGQAGHTSSKGQREEMATLQVVLTGAGTYW